MSPPSNPDRWSELESHLKSVATRAQGVVRERRTKDAALAAFDRITFIALLAVPTALILWVGLSQVGAIALPLPPLGWTLAITILAPAIAIGVRAARASREPVGRAQALALADHELGLEDRLVSAAEFVECEARTGFMEAALEDAEQAARVAEHAGLRAPAGAIPSRGWTSLAIAATALFVALVYWIGPYLGLDVVTPTTSGTGPVASVGESAERTATRKPSVAPDVAPEPERDTKESELPPLESGTDPQVRPGTLTEETKKTRGRTGQGSSANASSSSGASDSRDSPSSQGQSSLEPPKTTPKKPKPAKERKPRDAEGPNKKKKEEKSGATAGRGMASGSTKSPDASEWDSKDQVVSEDEADLESDEEVDDEFDDQDARGGLQPQLRDRKPPVNRDLSIGFGNQKNPDANGRGGQSEQKKSRGVASLVLGVSIPDHVKGRPNPGKTKVTQERVEPRREDSAVIDAAPRPEREAPVGEVTRTELAPWMRRLLRDYYLSLRGD